MFKQIALCCCLFIPLAAHARLCINEILPKPGALSPCTGSVWEGEYIELYNNGNETLDVSGYRVEADGTPGPPLFSVSTSQKIPPYGYALIIPATAAGIWQRIRPSVPLYTDGRNRLGGYGLRNAGMRLVLYGASGEALSSVTYTSDPGPDTALERSGPDMPDTPGTWIANPWGGTPGTANHSGRIPFSKKRFLLETPGCRPASGIALMVRITLTQQERAHLDILTLKGRKLGRVASLAGFEGSQRIPWYGTSGGGRALKTGCYLLRLTVRQSGSIVYRRIRPVTLVRE